MDLVDQYAAIALQIVISVIYANIIFGM